MRPIALFLLSAVLTGKPQIADGGPEPLPAPRAADLYGDPLPDGAVARLGTARLRAGEHIAFTPDGKSIITLTSGGRVRVRDAKTGELREQYDLPEDRPRFICLSSDGRVAVNWESGKFLNVWDVSGRKRVLRFVEPQLCWFSNSSISPRGRTLVYVATALEGGIIHVLDLTRGTRLRVPIKERGVSPVAFSPDESRFILTTENGAICWETATGRKLWEAESAAGEGGRCRGSLGFSADGRLLIGLTEQADNVRWQSWDANTGRPVGGLKFPEPRRSPFLPTWKPVLARDGRTLIIGKDNHVELWDCREGRPVGGRLPGQLGAFAPDDRSFLTDDGALHRWELPTGRPLLPDVSPFGHTRNIEGLAFSPDGKQIASCGTDSAVRLWDVTSARSPHTWRTTGSRSDSEPVFTADGKHLILLSAQGEVVIREVGSGGERTLPVHSLIKADFSGIAYKVWPGPDGKTLITHDAEQMPFRAPTNSRLSVWDREMGHFRSSVQLTGIEPGRSVVSPDGRCILAKGQILELPSGKLRLRLEEPSETTGWAAFSGDGSRVADRIVKSDFADPPSSRVEAVSVWDVPTGRRVAWVPTGDVGRIALSPDGRYLAAAHRDGPRLWEVASGREVRHFDAGEPGFAGPLVFPPDGKTLATGHGDGQILLWDLTPPGLPAAPADASEMDRLWNDLARSDAAKARRIVWRMARAPGVSLPLLRERLKPAAPIPLRKLRPLLEDLDHPEFRVREAAERQLRALGDRAGPALRAALEGNLGVEQQRRLKRVVAALEKPGFPSPETLREVRAVEALERIGTPEAVALIEALAGGMPEARLTKEAKAALERLARVSD